MHKDDVFVGKAKEFWTVDGRRLKVFKYGSRTGMLGFAILMLTVLMATFKRVSIFGKQERGHILAPQDKVGHLHLLPTPTS